MLLRHLCGIDDYLHDWILINKFVNIILKSSELHVYTTRIFGSFFAFFFPLNIVYFYLRVLQLNFVSKFVLLGHFCRGFIN